MKDCFSTDNKEGVRLPDERGTLEVGTPNRSGVWSDYAPEPAGFLLQVLNRPIVAVRFSTRL